MFRTTRIVPSSNTLCLVGLFLFQFLCLEKVEHPDEKWERERKIPPLHLLIWNPVNCSYWTVLNARPETKREVRRGRQLKTERECTSGNQLYMGRRHGSLGSVTWHPKRKEQERRKRGEEMNSEFDDDWWTVNGSRKIRKEKERRGENFLFTSWKGSLSSCQ